MAAVVKSVPKRVPRKPRRYPELSHLPKPTRFKSIQGSYQTPGSLEPFFNDNKVFRPKQLVDPTHPAAWPPGTPANSKPKATRFPFIWTEDRSIGVKIRPLGLLLNAPPVSQFPHIPILKWKDRVRWAKAAGIEGNPQASSPRVPAGWPYEALGRQLYPAGDYNNFVIPSKKVTPRGVFLQLALKRAAHRVPISLHISTSKKRMGQDRHMRRRIEKRLRAAVNIIVTRGAAASTVPDGKTVDDASIVLSDSDAGRRWVMQGWAYMFYPNLEVYNMPYSTLIAHVRSILSQVNQKAINMENFWLNRSLLLDKDTPEPEPHANDPVFMAHATLANRANADGTAPANPSGEGEKGKEAKKLPSKPRKADQISSSLVLAGKDPLKWKKELMQGLEMMKLRVPLAEAALKEQPRPGPTPLEPVQVDSPNAPP